VKNLFIKVGIKLSNKTVNIITGGLAVLLFLVYDFYSYQTDLTYFYNTALPKFFNDIADKDGLIAFEDVVNKLSFNYVRWDSSKPFYHASQARGLTITGLLKDGDNYFGMSKIHTMEKSFLLEKFNESDIDSDGLINDKEFRDWLNSVKGGKNM
jgi:hypothetical protein